MLQGDGGKRMNPPPDVIFAQKATAIVKAAGMDPRNIDLERFRQNAPHVFSRAYSAIYKEKLLTVLTENSSKEDKILNSQLVLDGLFTKTRNPILLQLSGADVYEGNHRAIGVLVGILFAEGQRLWLEKIRSVEPQADPPVDLDASRERDMQLRVAQDMLDQNDELDLLGDDQEEEEDSYENHGFGGQEIRESLRTLHKLRSNPDIGLVEHERLLSRIAFLEEQLKKKPRRKAKKHGTKKNLVKRISEAILQDNEINERGRERGRGLFDDASGDERLHTTRSTPRGGSAGDDEGRREYARGGSSRSPNRRGDGVGIAEGTGKKTRPVSAPSTSHRKSKVRHVSNRLYSAALSRKDTEDDINRARSRSPSRKNVADTAHSSNNNQSGKEYFDPSLYTYDWKSGRRVLLSVAQLEAEERKRSKEAMSNIMAITDNEVDALMGGGGGKTRPGSPGGKPNYPSKSISGDVDKWLQRMRRERHGEVKPPTKPEDAAMPEPRYFAAYQKLQDRDLIITIEHCHNCAHHNVTTRHKQDEYANNSCSFLRVLAQIAHECGVCARVGVSRVKANVTPASATTDENSRIGAFEIQVAYKQPNGKVVPATLHSKLSSRRWPSKSVLEKRFRSFVAQAKVSTSHGDDEDRNSAVRMADDSAAPYPVGTCSWALSPVADPSWSFTAVEPAATPAATGAADTKGVQAAAVGNTAGISNVQWAFDMREMAEAPPKFTVGATIRVKALNFPSGGTERHALLCVVKEYIDASDAHASDIVVKPMYMSQDVRVPQRNCINLSSYTDRDVYFTEEAVPVELEALLLLAKEHKLTAWDLSKGDGRKDASGDICLSRKGFFNQVRKLCWAVEKKVLPKGQSLVAHPVTAVDVDLQQSYSEEVMNWVFNAFKGEGNVTALERMATQNAPTPVKPAPGLVGSGSLWRVRSPVMGSTASGSMKGSASGEQLAASQSEKVSSVPSVDEQRGEEAPPAETGVPSNDVPVPEETANSQSDDGGVTTVAPATEDAPEGGTVEPAPSAEQSIAAHPSPPATTDVDQGSDANKADSSESAPQPASQDTTSEPAKSASPAKRFSRIDLVGAADKALKNKIVSALAHPGQAYDGSLSAMERMSLLYQLSDTVFEEAVVESDENAELSHATFLSLLRSFGLSELLANQSALEALLQKGKTSASTPEVPVQVESFMNWLISGESSRHKQGTPELLRFRIHWVISNILSSIAAASTKARPAEESTPPAPVEVEGSATTQEPPATQPEQPAVPEQQESSQAAQEPAPTSQREESPRAPTSAPATERSAPANTSAATSVPPSPRPQAPAEQDSTVADAPLQKSNPSSARASPRGEFASRPSSQKSMLATGANPSTARSTDDPETAARKQEDFRKSLTYQPKEMEISSIVIEGDQLVHTFYDTVMVNVKIGVQEWNAITCMAREKGSKRRSYNVKWPEVMVSESQFRNDSATVTVAVSDPTVVEANTALPYLNTTALGEAPHSIKIPLYYFMSATFDVCRELHVTPVVVTKVGAPQASDVVKLTIHGNARDPKGVRTARIMSMRPQELLNIKFDPIPLDDAEDLYESDQDSVESAAHRGKRGKAGAIQEESAQEVHDEVGEELNRTLYPRASMADMSSLAAKPGAPLVNTLLE
jgi:hypothetical protein